MKKIISLSGVALLLIFFLGGCAEKKKELGQQIQKAEENFEQTQKQIQGDMGEIFQGGKKMKCEFSMSDGGETYKSTSWIDGKKSRTVSNGPEGQTVVVFDGEDYYTWVQGQKNGLKMNVKCLEELDQVAPEQDEESDFDPQAFQNPEDLLADSGVKSSCGEVDSVDVSVPGDINFADQCEMLKKQMQMFQDMQNQMPEVPAWLKQDDE